MVIRSKIVVWPIIIIAAASSGYALMPIYPKPIILLLLTTLLLMLVFSKRLRINKLIITFLFSILFVGFISSFSDPVNISATFKVMVVILFSYLFVSLFDYKDFVKVYVYFMMSVSMVSVLAYIFTNFLNVPLNSYLSEITNDNGMSYRHIYILFVFSSEYMSHRNTGIFWEPGIFASYLSLALILTTHVKFKKDSLVTAFISLTMLTTYSVLGYILLILTLAVKYSNSVSKKVFIAIVLLCLVGIGMMFHQEALNTFREYLPSMAAKVSSPDSNSLVHRIQSPLLNFHIFMESPLFGSGLNAVNDIYESNTDIAQTSTMTYYMAAFGVFGFLYSVIVFYATVLNKALCKSFLSRIATFVIIIIILNKEPHIYFCFTYIILFYWCMDASKRGTD